MTLQPASESLPAKSPWGNPYAPMANELAASRLTQEQYEGIKGYWLRSSKPEAWRNVLMLMLLRNTGFRPSEVVRPQKSKPRKHFDWGAYLAAGQVIQYGPVYWVNVLRAKKRERPEPTPMYLNPVLGRPLFEYIKGNNLKETDPVFAMNTRQLANVWYEACEATLGFKKEPTSLRDLYVTTVSRLAREIVGYGHEDMVIASKMVGHEDVRTTRGFYEKLTPEERRAIQERVPV